jgi:ankyrin repeat protein
LVAVSRALAGGLETLAISSVDAHKGVAGAKQNDEESLKAAEVQNCMEPADHKSNTDGYLQESNAEKASRSRSSKRPIIGPIDSDEKLDVPIRQRTRPSSMAKEETEHDREVSLRREALQAATRNNETWPFTDFQGQRMSCTAEDWESPSRFLKAIQSDTFFMKHLKHIDKAQYLRFKTARVDELFPMMHLLLLNGLAVNSKGYRSHYGETPLHQSVSYLWGGDQKNFTIGKLLVGFGAEVSRVTVKNESCLHIAAYGKDNELLRIILDLDQSMINQLDLGGSTPIMNAAYMGRYALVDMLIKRGADFRYTNREGFTPALRAALEGHVKVLKIFVDNGLDVDEVSSSLPLRTNTRLIHMAAEYGRTNVVEYLLSKGADPTHRVPGKRFGSYTAYDLAKRGGFHEVARILKQAEEEWIQWKQRQGFRRRKI